MTSNQKTGAHLLKSYLAVQAAALLLLLTGILNVGVAADRTSRQDKRTIEQQDTVRANPGPAKQLDLGEAGLIAKCARRGGSRGGGRRGARRGWSLGSQMSTLKKQMREAENEWAELEKEMKKAETTGDSRETRAPAKPSSPERTVNKPEIPKPPEAVAAATVLLDGSPGMEPIPGASSDYRGPTIGPAPEGSRIVRRTDTGRPEVVNVGPFGQPYVNKADGSKETGGILYGDVYVPPSDVKTIGPASPGSWDRKKNYVEAPADPWKPMQETPKSAEEVGEIRKADKKYEQVMGGIADAVNPANDVMGVIKGASKGDAGEVLDNAIQILNKPYGAVRDAMDAAEAVRKAAQGD